MRFARDTNRITEENCRSDNANKKGKLQLTFPSGYRKCHVLIFREFIFG